MSTERQLRDEIRLREASLEDAHREQLAGELSSEEFAVIVERESRALSRAHHSLDALATAVLVDASGSTVRRRHRRSRLVVALVCFALAAVVLAWANVGLRQAGSSATGGLSLSSTQRLQQLVNEGEADVAAGDDAAALVAYQQILTMEPTNVVALTEAGWLEASAGSKSGNVAVVTHGIGLLHDAVTLAPSSPAPRLYYAIVAYETPGNRALALKEFTIFLRLHPSGAQVAIASPFVRALGLKT